MRMAWNWLVCGFVFAGTLSAGAAEGGKLLPTASLAKQVNALSILLSDSPHGTTMESRRLAGFAVRDKISQFIIDQIETKPDITKDQLHAQLLAILCSNEHAECGCDHPPYVFTNGWIGPKGTSQFVVAYQISLGFMGPTGSITAVESYLVEEGKKVHRTARGGGEFDAYVANFQMVQQFFDPAEIWVLAWGMVQGGSGRGLHGRAAVYRAATDAVKIAWDDAREDNLTAQTNAIGWEVNYADHDRLYGNDPNPYFLDIYKIDYPKLTFTRVVHYQHRED
jgi:hypothetical protein